MVAARVALSCFLGCILTTTAVSFECTTPNFVTKPTETHMKGSSTSLAWVESSDQIIFATTTTGQVLRSTNGGLSWRDETDGHLKGIVKGQKQVVEMKYNLKQPHGQIFFVGIAGSHWATLDNGETYIQPCGLHATGEKCIANPGGDNVIMAPDVKLHPKLPDHLLAKVKRDACFRQGDSSVSSDCTDDLMHSPDFGITWINLTEHSEGEIVGFRDFEWAGDSNDDKLAILATVYRDPQHIVGNTAFQEHWDKHLDFVRSNDMFKAGGPENEDLLPCGNIMYKNSGKVFVAAPKDCNKVVQETRNQGVDLFISMDKGTTLHKICLPVSINSVGFAILDVDHEAIFMAVDHDEEDALESMMPAGNVYKSDSSMELFSLAQRHIYMDRNTELADFARVQGLPGTIITNQFDITALDDPAIASGARAFLSFVKTTISFSDGASWQPIPAPTVDAQGKPIKCYTGHCSLHLHGESSWVIQRWDQKQKWFPAVYSQHHAPGVVMAIGNVGKYLSQDENMLDTYISRDGGQTFEQIAKGVNIYEFGDKGGMIVWAKHSSIGPTDEIFYSRDEGRCVEGPLKLKQPIYVQNIRMEPDSTGHVFLVRGFIAPDEEQAQDPDLVTGIIVHVDFQGLITDHDFPACTPIVDYEWWSPTQHHCLLGHNITIERRKRESRCWNGPAYSRERAQERTKCQCNFQDDVQCEYGFERKLQMGPNDTVLHNCVPILDLNASKCAADLGLTIVPEGNYIMKNDVCLNPEAVLVAPAPPPKPHHHRPHHKPLSAGMTFFITILCLAAVCGATAYAWTTLGLAEYAPPELREKVDAAWDWVKAKLGKDGYDEVRDTFQPLAGDDVFPQESTA